MSHQHVGIDFPFPGICVVTPLGMFPWHLLGHGAVGQATSSLPARALV